MERTQESQEAASSQHLGSGEKITLEEAYYRSGGFGRYQFFVLLVMWLAHMGGSCFLSNIVFFEMKPRSFECTFASRAGPLQGEMLNQISRGQVATLEQRQCSIQEVCQGESGLPNSEKEMTEWRVRADLGTSPMKNLITDFDLLCASKFEVGLIGSMYFFGESFGSFLYTFFIVKRQRTRRTHLIAKGLGLTLAMVLLTLVSHKALLFACMFVIGLCQSVGIIQGYAFMLESVPLEWRNLVATAGGVVDKVILLLSVIYLKINSQNWILFMIPGVLCMGASFLLSFLLLDSPQYHFDKGDKGEAARIFKHIGRANGLRLKIHRDLAFAEKEPEGKTYDTMKEEGDQDTSSNVGNGESGQERSGRNEVVFENQFERAKYVFCILVWCVVMLDDNLLSFMLKNYQGDIYNNMLVLIFSGCIASYLAYYLIGRMDPSLALAAAFSILALAGGLIYPSMGSLVLMIPSAGSSNAVATSALSLAKLGAGSAHHLVYLFIIWSFKAHQVSFVFASSNLLSRLIACLAPQVGELEMPLPMLVIGCSAFVCSLACLVLFANQEDSPKEAKPLSKDLEHH